MTDATMMEQTKPQMSVIFPTEPNKVVIHPLPKEANLITYSVRDLLWIESWLPDGYKTINQEIDMDNDDFYHTFCDGCTRNCYSFLSKYEDEDNDVDWDHPDLNNHCNVYDDGYHGQHCPEGHSFDDSDDSTINFSVAPMVFGIALHHLSEDHYNRRFDKVTDTAYLCDGYEDEDGFHRTDSLIASNVYGNSDDIGNICWGGNARPQNLANVVDTYFSSPFNNDLTPLPAFEQNSDDVKSYVHNNAYHLDEGTKVLCNFSPDALMIIDASKDISAFFYLLSAGFKSIPEAPHVMMVPLFNKTVEKDGNTFDGYVTVNDAVDKEWFVTHDGLLVGQV